MPRHLFWHRPESRSDGGSRGRGSEPPPLPPRRCRRRRRASSARVGVLVFFFPSSLALSSSSSSLFCSFFYAVFCFVCKKKKKKKKRKSSRSKIGERGKKKKKSAVACRGLAGFFKNIFFWRKKKSFALLQIARPPGLANVFLNLNRILHRLLTLSGSGRWKAHFYQEGGREKKCKQIKNKRRKRKEKNAKKTWGLVSYPLTPPPQKT